MTVISGRNQVEFDASRLIAPVRGIFGKTWHLAVPGCLVERQKTETTMGIPQNRLFCFVENPIEMDDERVPPSMETPN